MRSLVRGVLSPQQERAVGRDKRRVKRAVLRELLSVGPRLLSPLWKPCAPHPVFTDQL